MENDESQLELKNTQGRQMEENNTAERARRGREAIKNQEFKRHVSERARERDQREKAASETGDRG